MGILGSIAAAAIVGLTLPTIYDGTSITGRIHDVDGRPLKDVAVTAESKVKTFSDEKGEFTIQPAASSGKVRILFESPGYYPETLLYEIGSSGESAGNSGSQG